jgi:hypothetical protein
MQTAPVAVETLPEFVPCPSPDLRITQADGSGFWLLEALTGKVTALYFCMSGCAPCQEICRNLNPLVREFAGIGFQAVAALINDDARFFLPCFNRMIQPEYRTGYISRAEGTAYMGGREGERYVLPRLLLIDRSGVIQRAFRAKEEVYRTLGNVNGSDPATFRSEIQNLL